MVNSLIRVSNSEPYVFLRHHLQTSKTPSWMPFCRSHTPCIPVSMLVLGFKAGVMMNLHVEDGVSERAQQWNGDTKGSQIIYAECYTRSSSTRRSMRSSGPWRSRTIAQHLYGDLTKFTHDIWEKPFMSFETTSSCQRGEIQVFFEIQVIFLKVKL